MNTQTYIAAVQAMVGLRPDMIEHLVALAPSLTDAKRAKVIADLTPLHDGILKASDEVFAEIEHGEKEISAARKAERQAAEKQDQASADSVFDESSSGPTV